MNNMTKLVMHATGLAERQPFSADVINFTRNGKEVDEVDFYNKYVREPCDDILRR